VSGQPYGTYEPAPQEPGLPIGVAILAVLIGIVGFVLIIAGVLLAALNVSLHLSFAAFSSYGPLLLGVILLIVGLIILGVALGLWHQRLWALVLAIIVFGFYFISDALVGAWFSLGAIISLILVVYLIAVHRHFV
jgi:hypothetical protein